MIANSAITVKCDGEDCDFFDTFTVAPHPSQWNSNTVAQELDAMGWETIGGDEHLCPSCAAERRERDANQEPWLPLEVDPDGDLWMQLVAEQMKLTKEILHHFGENIDIALYYRDRK